MGWIPARITQPRPERRMLERPPAVDEVAGLERFRCLDLTCVLTRRACADRWRTATSLRSKSGGFAVPRDRLREAGVGATGRGAAAMAMHGAAACRGCPVGQIHAREERARPRALRAVRAVTPRPTTPSLPPSPGAPPPAERFEQRDAARAVQTSPAEVVLGSLPGPTSAGLRPSPEEDRMPKPDKPKRRSGPVGRTLTHQGKTQTIAEWARELGLCASAVRARLANGWPVERVLGPREAGQPREPGAARQRPQAVAPKALAPKRPAPAPRVAEERVVATTTVVVPAAPRHPAVELLEAVGYQVRQLAAPSGVVLLVEGRAR